MLQTSSGGRGRRGTRVLLSDDDTPSQNHFKIGEVAELLGVRPHVLRYWEQEFPLLRPKKTRGAHRHYSRANLALARTIHALVVEQGYSIAGARKRLDELARAGGSSSDAAHASEGDRFTSARSVAHTSSGYAPSLRDELLSVRDDLEAILAVLDASEDSRDAEPSLPDAPVVPASVSSRRETEPLVVHTVVARDVPRSR